MSIVQEIMMRSTDYPRRIIALVVRTRRSHNVFPVPALQQFPLEDYVWWVSGGEIHKVCGARFVEKSTIEKQPNRLLMFRFRLFRSVFNTV